MFLDVLRADARNEAGLQSPEGPVNWTEHANGKENFQQHIELPEKLRFGLVLWDGLW